ncbi:MAG: polysaccharide pyruvyl transferase family protein [Actinomycetota bacterium]
MPTALLAGAFGQSNPGDEAILESFLAALPDWRAVATSADPQDTRARHGCDAVAVGDRRAVAGAVRSSDGLVFAGGTIFKRLHPSTGRTPLALLANAVALAVAARGARKPVALLGVGAGDLRGRPARSLARRLVGLSQLVVLRDAESAAVLAGAGVAPPFRVGADPVWTVVGDTARRRRDEVVVVALSHLAAGAGAALADGLAPLAEAGLEVHLQPWQGGRSDHDGDLARDLACRLGGTVRVIDPPASVGEACETFARAKVVVGLRFHSLVAAASSGTPFVAVAHEPKLEAAARRFGQPAVQDGAGLAGLPAAVADAVAGPPPSAAVAHGEAAAAEEGFRLLRLVLSGGQGDDLDTMTGLPLVPEAWRP